MARKMRFSDRNVSRLRVEKSEYTVWNTPFGTHGSQVLACGSGPPVTGHLSYSTVVTDPRNVTLSVR